MKAISTLFIACFATISAHGQIYVAADALSGANDGSSWANAYVDLQDAIDAVTADYQEIWIKTNTYRPSRDISGDSNPTDERSKCFYVPDYITIFRGGFNGTETTAFQANPNANPTIIDGNIGNVNDSLDNIYNLFHLGRGCDLIGLTIQESNGYGSPSLYNTAVLATSDETTRIMNCILKRNYSNYRGGAVCQTNGQGTIFSTESRYEENHAYDQGGAIYSDGTCQLDHCLFSNNLTSYGGAIKIGGSGTNRAVYCTFVENEAIYRGASIQMYNAEMEVSNCSFYGNACSSGEFSTYMDNGWTGSFVVNNSLIITAGSTVIGDVHSGANVFTFNTCISTSNFSTGVVNNCSTEDPMFANPPSNLSLQACSPAVENSSAVSVTYFNSEPFDGTYYDLGSKEYFKPSINASQSDLYLANSFPAQPTSWAWINCATGNPIAGETGTTFTPATSGNYAVVAIFGNCSDTSNCVQFNTAGINKLTGDVFSVYPNPANDFITIETKEPIQLTIYSSHGQLLYSGSHQQLSTIDISMLTAGVYFVRDASGSTVRFVKQ